MQKEQKVLSIIPFQQFNSTPLFKEIIWEWENSEDQFLTQCLIDEEKCRRLNVKYEKMQLMQFEEFLNHLYLLPKAINHIVTEYFFMSEDRRWVIERLQTLAKEFQNKLGYRMEAYVPEFNLFLSTWNILQCIRVTQGYESLFLPNRKEMAKAMVWGWFKSLYAIKNYFDFFAALMYRSIDRNSEITLYESLSKRTNLLRWETSAKEEISAKEKISEFLCLLLSFHKCALKCCSLANIPLHVAYEMPATMAKLLFDRLKYLGLDEKLMVETSTGKFGEAGNLLMQKNYASQRFFICPGNLIIGRRIFNSYTKFDALKELRDFIDQPMSFFSRSYQKRAESLMDRLLAMPHCHVEIDLLIRDIDKLLLSTHIKKSYKKVLEKIKAVETIELKKWC